MTFYAQFGINGVIAGVLTFVGAMVFVGRRK